MYNPDKFQNPLAMQSQLNERHRKVITLIDPHIKNDPNYPVVDELKKRDLTIRTKTEKHLRAGADRVHHIELIASPLLPVHGGQHSSRSTIGKVQHIARTSGMT